MKIKNILTLSFILCFTVAARAFGVGEFIASRGLDSLNTAFLVFDLEKGETLAEYNRSKPLTPASIMKCVTVATLLHHDGHSRSFHTKVYTTGPVIDGSLSGNLLIVGSGDPSLNSRHEPKSADICAEIVSALRKEGIKEIKGRIVVDEKIFSGPAVPPSWATGDLAEAYGTGSHGLNFEDNALGGRSVANPSQTFISRLKAALKAAGITLGLEDIKDGKDKLLVDHESAPYDEIMRSCMMRSDNQFAEALLRSFAVNRNRPGATELAARLEREFWHKQGAPLEGVNIVDGSGLSRSNKVTADFMASVLKEMSGDPYYASFFPLAGQEGTLRKFLAGTPLEGYIAMKTGSMRGIQCYAGYKLDDDYVPTHVVVVIMNQMSDRAAARQALSKLLLEIFSETN